MLYSIVISYNDDEFVVQCEADSPVEAIHIGVGQCGEDSIRIFNQAELLELKSDIESNCDSNSCVAVDGLQNVWCDGFSVKEKYVQMHVVKTHEGR